MRRELTSKLQQLEILQVYERLVRERGETIADGMPAWPGCLPEKVRLTVRFHDDSAAIAELASERGFTVENDQVHYFDAVFLTLRIGEVIALPQVDAITAPDLEHGDPRGELLGSSAR